MSRGVATTALSLKKQIPDVKIQKCITECLRSMKGWGLEVTQEIKWSMKKMDAFATTTSVSGESFIRIALNQGLATQAKRIVMDTIYHELAHVVAGVSRKHGAEWKRVVEIIRQHTGLPIRVNGRIEDITNDFWYMGYKYVMRCDKCGQMVGFNTKNDLVNNPREWDEEHNCQRFTHRECGGSWTRIK